MNIIFIAFLILIGRLLFDVNMAGTFLFWLVAIFYSYYCLVNQRGSMRHSSLEPKIKSNYVGGEEFLMRLEEEKRLRKELEFEERKAKRIQSKARRSNPSRVLVLQSASGFITSSNIETINIDSTNISSDDDFISESTFLDGFNEIVINPATGEMMIGGIAGVDASGNPYGIDLHSDSYLENSCNDSFSSVFDDSMSLFDDSCSNFDDSTSLFDDSFSNFDDQF